jgi:phosphoglycolate phosphatase-like HAD superfamily hydrolase
LVLRDPSCILAWARAASLPVKPTVLLFDVDGTLVTTCGAGRRAIERAFELRYGTKDVVAFSFGGMTDKAIVRNGLQALGRTFADEAALDAEIDAALEFYLTVLADEVARTQIRIHDGMVRAMDMADARSDVALGLGTGNIRKGAAIKLRCVGIYDRFAFGGFGDDSIDRPTLLMAGARRGAETLGTPIEDCRIVVIGDTPKDISAAKAIGADCVAVATGMHDVAELKACDPTVVFANLADPRAPDVLFGR